MNRVLFILFLLTIVACKGSENTDEVKNSPLVGTAEVWCDESLKSIISQQEDIFESAYKYAKVNIQYAPEQIIMRKFYADSIDVMIVSHGIDSIDMNKFNKREIYPRQYLFGKSALAFICNKNRPKSEYTYKEMLALLSGEKGGQSFAVENSQSGIALELTKHLGKTSLSKNIYALKTKDDVIEWVNNNPDGIGIIDWSNISDEDDPNVRALLTKIRLIGIGRKDKLDDPLFYSPYQENLNGLYPFTRELHYIRRIGITNVSLGFASFICEQRGQKIMLKAGLLPQYQSERWIEFKGMTDIKVVN